MTDTHIPVIDLQAQLKPLRGELEAAFSRCLDTNQFCLGEEVEAFEKAFAEFCEMPYAVGVNSGTSALHLAMRLLDLGPGDEVITTPMTFVATAWVINYTGAKPVFVDIDSETWNLDPGQISQAVTGHTRAIVPVHLYGQPCEMDPILAVADEHGLAVVEDAAQAHGASYRGKAAGSLGRYSAFSFYPGKNLGACGEGGALLMHDEESAERARQLRNHASAKRYHHNDIGYNYRMEGIQGAVLALKLKRLRSWTEARQAIARSYLEQLQGLPLQLPTVAEGIDSAWHLFVVRTERREELAEHLASKNIGTGLHYPIPLHLQPAFSYLGHEEGAFPKAEALARECLSIPMYPEMSESQISRVVEAIRSFF